MILIKKIENTSLRIEQVGRQLGGVYDPSATVEQLVEATHGAPAVALPSKKREKQEEHLSGSVPSRHCPTLQVIWQAEHILFESGT